MHIPRIVIVGGGFAGAACAKTLRRRLPSEACEIVVFNRENHMVFHPLLPEVAGASLQPDAVAAPLRRMLGGVQCRAEDVVGVDPRRQAVAYIGHDGLVREMAYDHVVVACGREVSLGTVPGMADHAFPLKTVGDAMALRSHVMQQLERAEVCEDAERRRWYLTFLIVGGGFSGVEAAGEINDLLHASREHFPRLAREDIRVELIHSGDQLLPEVNPSLRVFAAARLQRAGVTLTMKARVAAATPDGVWLVDGRMLRGGTVVCTIGTSASPVVERMGVRTERGALPTEPDMRISGLDGAWAVGDCARIVNSHDGQSCPPTGQFADRQGRQVAENIVRVLRDEPTRPFHHKAVGQLCSIGGRTGVAEVFGVRTAGFLSWVLWRSVYLAKIPTWSKRVRVGLDWAWELLFSRDLVHSRTDHSERVSHAFYQPGEYVFREGDHATSLYIIERGEVEVLRRSAEGDARPIAILGPGDFFGEMALMERRPHSAGVRARTALEVVVMGQTAFSQVSASLAPLRHMLAEAARRRSTDVWHRVPIETALLSGASLSTFLEPVSPPFLNPQSTFEDALGAFADNRTDVCYVLDDRGALAGLVTRSDLLRGVELLMTRPPEARPGLTVGEFMIARPVTVGRDESSLVAASIMRERGLKGLPVVVGHGDARLEGYVRLERLLSWLLMHARQSAPGGVAGRAAGAAAGSSYPARTPADAVPAGSP